MRRWSVGLPAAAALAVAGTVLVPLGVAAPVGFPFAEGPPAGHTGGFGEPTCLVCHTEYPLNADDGSIEVDGFPERWSPGETRVMTVVLRSSGMAKAGFQLAIRHADGRQAGDLSATTPAVAVVDSLGVQFARQTGAGAEVLSPESASWTVVWTAPDDGDVLRLDVAANSANGDNSPFGDLVYHRSMESRRTR